MSIIKTIIAVLSLGLVILPSVLIKLLNVKKGVRYKQIRYPVIALLFSTAVCILFSYVGKLLSFIINLNFVQAFINWLSPGGKLDYVMAVYSVIIVNSLILFAFWFVKGLFKVGINKIRLPERDDKLKGLKKLYLNVISIFFDTDSVGVYPRRTWVKIQYTLRYASWIVSAVCLLMILLLQAPVFSTMPWIPFDFLTGCLTASYLWPALSLIVVNEIRWFLDGKEEFRKPGKMVFDHSEVVTVADYGELAEQYKEQFPERFGAYVKGESKGASDNFFNDALAEGELDAAVVAQLRERGFVVNHDYLTCVKHLLDKEDVLVDASLFSEFGEYLFVYLNTILSGGDNVLFLCADDQSADNITEYLSDKFKNVNNFHAVWNIAGKANVHGSADNDVLVLTPDVVFDGSIDVSQDKFFKRLSSVVLVNAAEIIAKDGVGLTALAHKLRTRSDNGTSDRLQYICLSESVPAETSNTLKQLLNLQGSMYVCDGYRAFDNTHLMLWNYESSRVGGGSEKGRSTMAQDNLFGETVQTYWGVSVPLACVGIKYMVDKLSIISHRGTPCRQIIDSMKQYKSRLSPFFGRAVDDITVDGSILVNKVDTDDDRTAFLIVEDDLNNLPLAIYNYSRFGGTDTTMLHIVSKPYMLRDYFMASAESYVDDEAKISMITPVLAETKHVVVEKILCEAMDGGIGVEDLLVRLNAVDPSIVDVKQALKFCRDIAFPGRSHLDIEHFFSFFDKRIFDRERVEYKTKAFIRLKESISLAECSQHFKQAKLEIRGVTYNLGIYAERLYQHFVPSQTIVFNGELFVITDIDTEQGIVRVRDASDTLSSSVDYVQVREYSLGGAPRAVDYYPVPYDSIENRITGGYDVTLYHDAKVSVDTLGYYALNHVSAKLDLANGPSYIKLSENERAEAKREYTDAKMISFRIRGVGADKSDRVAFLLSVIMNELMRTIFPYSHNCIAVCPVLSDPDTIYADPMGEKIKNAYPRIVTGDHYEHDSNDVEVMIIEDSPSDTGVINTLLQNAQYPFTMFFDVILSYLRWYTTFEDKGNISKKYLYFGSDEEPGCFDFDTLMKICAEFEYVKRCPPIKVDRITSKGRCSYCHRDLFNVEYKEINDGAGAFNRKICSKCAQLIVKDEDELYKLYGKVRKYLCGTFGITLPNDISVRFATAEKIRKKLKTGDLRLVVGFASPVTRELWVEADAPAPNVMDVLAHELTHFWQFDNIEMSDSTYIEGHASYVELQYMRHENRVGFADWQEDSLMKRNDEYGEGFRRLKADLEARGDYNSFTYMLELFGDGGSAPPPQGGNGGDTDNGGNGGDTDNGDNGGNGTGNGDNGANGGHVTDNGGGTGAETGERNRTPGNCPRYGYNLLSGDKKRAYDLLKKAIVNFEPQFSFEGMELKTDDVMTALKYIEHDCPELFWLGKSHLHKMLTYTDTGKIADIEF
ncbi:MAG: hypothetical protein IJ519_04190, partial [Clostridia bacterium]|nr:hypothetical protein [Clostridia bacterium]